GIACYNNHMLEAMKKLIPRRLFKALQPPYHFLMNLAAALWYRFPSNQLVVIGVTGTSGKTSVVYMIARMLNSAGYKTGLTSTSVFSDGNREWLNNKKMTMPGRFFIQKFLRRMVRNNCRYTIVETTSQGIAQFRHLFINYDVLVFTNLYPEHIEAHGSFDKYRAAKGKLFAHLKNCRTKYINEERRVTKPASQLKKLDLTRVFKTIIVNGDDANADYFLNFRAEAKMAYSLNEQVSLVSLSAKMKNEAIVKDFTLVRGTNVKASGNGTKITINGQPINLKLLGELNAVNALTAAVVGLNQKLSFAQIKSGLEEIRGLAGKMEIINAGQNFTVIVDYAFEPEAMVKLYQTLGFIPHNKIIHVLGSAGGGRDQARRPILGSLAAKYADFIVVTNEDPYDEDPFLIINQVAAGAEKAGRGLNKDLFKILDRREAIKKALELAKEGDLVLLTGKGAEQFICVKNGQKIPWDEREVVREEVVEKMCIDK
ncbi:MAG: UDP-N-acetylmuramyl-tripeptide synthetase, partial [Candidatus Falkowbacteria bacterium]|nr:UDP-N-acetylmuramyl-tripeptide synthetase [Candidatus Falkowbacteria bacterium]